ncbi:MAG: type II CRISPR RNA-guided endonuclease Cas9 [Nitrospirae bacterium]|nr:type II CRISPR RNA-guided endonuclease Cas9 [Nitrospirota bacterium]MBF0536369.1 type II CRISPR RNA-guided endonuclease Cas9 [Nitrospirota bacterium]MBF0616600.1 type II CRISPR RNA-guided endonuclease Cas9 [Nitrospirota bacterium]
MAYTLGLDLGTNSIGWACVNTDSKKIIDAGVLIFQEGVNRKNGVEISKNTKRRLKRQLRRQYGRKCQRRDRLTEKLKEYQMFQDESALMFYAMNPYELRAKGLDSQLSKLEFGRVLLHLSKRRGFKSSRKSQSEDVKKDTAFKEDLKRLPEEIKANNCRTLGEYLYLLQGKSEKIRCKPTQRKLYEDEFELLWDKQSSYYPELTTELKKDLSHDIFFQRPLKSVASLIGKCTLEPEKKRCPKSAFEFQLFRILEQVNRLSYKNENHDEIKFYRTPDEEFSPETKDLRDKLIALLKSKEKCSFKDIKKHLKLDVDAGFNLEKDDDGALIGDKTSHCFRKIFKKKWDTYSDVEKEKILQVINFADDNKWLRAYASEKWGLDEKEVKAVAKIALEAGYANYSLKAINKILPFMLDGLNLHDAKIKAGYENSRGERSETEIIKNIRNPIVSKTLYELLALVNRLEKAYGVPELIKIEMARELKNSKEQRDKIRKKNFENKRKNDEAAKELITLGITPNSEATVKYKLWKECKDQCCPYTGKKIPINALFSSDSLFEIEHIIPYSRSLDDSFMNLTLCYVDENRRKGDKTPYECYNGSPQYDEILQRIKVLPKAKQRKFILKEIPEDFASRQLNDTAYMSREAVSLLSKYKVQPSKGQVTSVIRHLWGLNTILGPSSEKNRNDHRQHAIDAIVIALTEEKTINKLSQYSKYKRQAISERFPAPWEFFRNDVAETINRLAVSIRVNKRLRGQLHEETFYGKVTDKKNDKNMQMFRVRKDVVEDMKMSTVEQIADPKIREIIRNAVINGTIKSDPPTLPTKDGKNPIPIKKVITYIPSSNMILLPGRPDKKTYVAPGANHHIVIYRYKDNKGNVKQGGEVCSFFEAVKRFRRGEKVINKNIGDDKEFLYSLSKNEMFILDVDENEISLDPQNYNEISKKLYRVKEIDAGSVRVILKRHFEATRDEDPVRRVANTLKGIKVIVDRLGRITKAYD